MPSDPNLKPWGPKQPLAHARLNGWQDRTITEIRVANGLSIKRDGNLVTIGLEARNRPKPPPAYFFAQITGSSRDADPGDGAPFSWSYGFVEVEKTGPYTDTDRGWTTKEGGRTGTAYNLIEAQNGSSGLMGNGVDTNNLTDTSLEVQPFPTAWPVVMHVVAVPAQPGDPEADPPVEATEATTEYWFQYANGIDGGCT